MCRMFVHTQICQLVFLYVSEGPAITIMCAEITPVGSGLSQLSVGAFTCTCVCVCVVLHLKNSHPTVPHEVSVFKLDFFHTSVKTPRQNAKQQEDVKSALNQHRRPSLKQ